MECASKPVKLLVLVSRAAPAGKERSSPELGTVLPCQLAASFQLLLVVLAPVQIAVASSSRASSSSTRGPCVRHSFRRIQARGLDWKRTQWRNPASDMVQLLQYDESDGDGTPS